MFKRVLTVFGLASTSSLVGCSALVESVKHPTVFLVPKDEAVMILLEPVKDVEYELAAQDTLIRTKGDILPGAVFYYPSSEELDELMRR